MARANDFLIAFLMDVIADGAAIIDKRKLLWLMGKAQDRAAVWDELLGHWEELGMERDDLLGAEVHGKMVFLRSSASVEPVKKWA